MLVQNRTQNGLMSLPAQNLPVKDFQALLQALLLTEVKSANGNSWMYLLSANNTSWQRARLRRLRGWDEEVKQRK